MLESPTASAVCIQKAQLVCQSYLVLRTSQRQRKHTVAYRFTWSYVTACCKMVSSSPRTSWTEALTWNTKSQWYYHPQMIHVIDSYHCEYCQRHKLSGKGYGLLVKREMWIAPWEEVAVDLFQHKPRPPLKSSLKTGLGMMSEESIRCRDHGHVYWSKSLLFCIN